MKKAFISFLTICILSAGSVFAQGNKQANGAQEPPNRVKVNFNARYPDNAGNAKWKQNGEGYTASFRQNGQQTESEFNQDGRWVKSNTQIQESNLPADAKKYLKENHPQYQYTKGVKYDNEKGSRYEVDVRSQNKNIRLQFDKNGGFIDEKPL